MPAPLDAVDYADHPSQWDELVKRCRAAGHFGCDTEFYGVDPSEQSCVGRARIHVWSIALRTAKRSPLGFHHCRGWMLPAVALEHPPLRALLEDKKVRKDFHNKSVDQHSFANHGIRLRGARCTLNLTRWNLPHLVNSPGRFKLKALMKALLRREPVATFKQVVQYDGTVEVRKTKTVKRKECVCGEEKCRARKGHTKLTVTEDVEVVTQKKVKLEYPLESIGPKHPRFALLTKYSIEDSVAGLQIGELADAAKNPAPWPFGGKRPGYSQVEDDATIAMEAVGFPVDVKWCTETAAIAMADEEKELDWLFRWYVINAPTYGPHHRTLGMKTKGGRKNKAGVDSIWSSPAKLLALFDALEFPRSPVWGKGRVKRGDAKVDGAALQWIARNCESAKKLIARILHLKKVRSQLKYLVKLRDSGGFVHIICGPAGDEDERAGAVTGRKGVKGPLEAQQLPSKEDKDLYGVRRAIIA